MSCLVFPACDGDDTDPPVNGDGGGSNNLTGLLVSEVMFDPADTEAGNEWFELYNNTSRHIDIKKLTFKVGTRSTTVPRTTIIKSDQYFVVCIRKSVPDGGSDHCDFTWYYGSSLLTNTGTTIALEYGGKTIASLSYYDGKNDWPNIVTNAGKSTQLDGGLLGARSSGRLTATAANLGKNWCASRNTFAGKIIGSPGKANHSCGSVGDIGVSSDADGGVTPTSFAAGSLLISEVMYDPYDDDSTNEWLEIYNNSGADIASLAGVQLWVWSNSTGKTSSTKSFDLSAYAKKLPNNGFLLVRRKKPTAGTVPANTVYWAKMPALVNTKGSTVMLQNSGSIGKEIAKISFKQETPWPTKTSHKLSPGEAIQLDRKQLDARPRIAASVAADGKNWCPATTAMGTTSDVGTPGGLNTRCAEIAPTGQCRGTDGKWRNIVAPKSGQLVFTEVFANPKSTNDYKQWVEIKATAQVDLNGLLLHHVGGTSAGKKTTFYNPTHTCIWIKPGMLLVIGSSKTRNRPTATDFNGGVRVNVLVNDKTFLYATSSRTVSFKDSKGTIVASATHPAPSEGKSLCVSGTTGKWGTNTFKAAAPFVGTSGSPGTADCTHAP